MVESGVGPPRGSPAAIVFAVLAGIWTVGVVVLTQSAAWLVEQVVNIGGLAFPGWVWPAVAIVGALLVAVPAVPLALVPRSPAVRVAGRAWLTSAVCLALLGSLRGIPVQHNDLYLALLTVCAAALALVAPGPRFTRRQMLGRLRRWLAGQSFGSPSATLLAVAAGLACLLPWVWWGALGGWLETGLAILAALAVSWLASMILNSPFWWPYEARGRALLIVVGGLVAGVALVPLAASVGPRGIQLAMLVIVPPLAFVTAALQSAARPPRLLRLRLGTDDIGRHRTWPVRLLVATAVFGPLAFVDPEETFLIVNFDTRDVGFWAAVAALTTLVVALVVGLLYTLTVARRAPAVNIAAGAAIALGLATTVVYVVLGQPGLHGDRLFVVMKQQPDLAGLAEITDRGQRLRTTYQRLVEHADRTQAPLRKALSGRQVPYTPYYLVNGIEVHAGGPIVRAWLSTRSDVDRVLLSPRLRPLPAAPPVTHGSDAPPDDPQWNIEAVKADQVWRDLGITGQGIVVGQSDSGVDGTHPALHNGFRGGDDSWFDPWNHTRTPTDRGGHGTHTLGSAVGRAPNGAVPASAPGDLSTPTPGAVGVAPGAEWIGCVNLARNMGNPAHYLDCLQFMLAPFPYGGNPFRDGHPERAPHVLTNSWGCPDLEGCDPAALRPATAALAAAGIFFVAAAGNEGPRCGSIKDPPAPYPDVVSVGAVDRENHIAEFSSRGPARGGAVKPDVAAPGVGVLSALPDGTYGELEGTSMATPHVAGVVALMWSANPGLIGDLARTRQILMDTAKPALASGAGEDSDCGGPADLYGAGVVDALAAVRAAQGIR
jgi:hypothetical protein